VLRAHYGYGRWATDRVLTAAERLTPEQLEAPGVAGHGSVRGTLVHLIDTQWGWFSWFDGSLPPDEAYRLSIDPESLPDVPSIRVRWDAVQTQAEMLVNRLSEEELTEAWPLEIPNRDPVPTKLWQLLLHVANHGTQHRSDIAAMLTEHGQSPGGLDYLFYLVERNAQ
jgi:uncharacterized damage-inducible protein DinB